MAAYDPNPTVPLGTGYQMMPRPDYGARAGADGIDYQGSKWRKMQLNEALEGVLSRILQHGYDTSHLETAPAGAAAIKAQILTWAHHIEKEVPGKEDWEEFYNFTFELLHKPDASPGDDDTPIGTEKDLVDTFGHDMKQLYALKDEETEKEEFGKHDIALATARNRLDVLKAFRALYTPAGPMPAPLALLYRKVNNAYKMREAVLGHLGYFNGSLTFAAGIDDGGIHHPMYILDLKLRHPNFIHEFPAPKHSKFYLTDAGCELAWNNFFSFCYGFHEFGPTAMPPFGVNMIERKLVEGLRSEEKGGEKWTELCVLLGWDEQDTVLAAELARIKGGFVPGGKQFP